jgi:hypothetical protein
MYESFVMSLYTVLIISGYGTVRSIIHSVLTCRL